MTSPAARWAAPLILCLLAAQGQAGGTETCLAIDEEPAEEVFEAGLDLATLSRYGKVPVRQLRLSGEAWLIRGALALEHESGQLNLRSSSLGLKRAGLVLGVGSFTLRGPELLLPLPRPRVDLARLPPQGLPVRIAPSAAEKPPLDGCVLGWQEPFGGLLYFTSSKSECLLVNTPRLALGLSRDEGRQRFALALSRSNHVWHGLFSMMVASGGGNSRLAWLGRLDLRQESWQADLEARAQDGPAPDGNTDGDWTRKDSGGEAHAAFRGRWGKIKWQFALRGRRGGSSVDEERFDCLVAAENMVWPRLSLSWRLVSEDSWIADSLAAGFPRGRSWQSRRSEWTLGWKTRWELSLRLRGQSEDEGVKAVLLQMRSPEYSGRHLDLRCEFQSFDTGERGSSFLLPRGGGAARTLLALRGRGWRVAFDGRRQLGFAGLRIGLSLVRKDDGTGGLSLALQIRRHFG